MSKHTVTIFSVPLLIETYSTPQIIIRMLLKRLDTLGMVKNHYFLHHFGKEKAWTALL